MQRTIIAAVGLAILATVAGRASVHVNAQTRSGGLVQLSVTPEEATERGTVPVSYRIYGEPFLLRFAVSFSNESNDAVTVDRDAVQESFGLHLYGAQDIPIVVRWPAEIRMPGEWRRADSGIRLQVDPQTSSSWFVTVERADGTEFAAGRYSLQWEASRVQSAIRTVEGSPWQGRTPSTKGTVFLELARATTPPDIASMYMMSARDAMLARDFDGALEAYSRAVATDPSDVRAQMGLAGMLLHRKRYREAIGVYERLLPDPSRWQQGGLLLEDLAMAYLGVGDEQKARQIFRQSGMDTGLIEKKITELKQINSRR